MKKETYLDVDVCTVNMDSTIDEINKIIESRKASFVVAINPEKIMKAQRDRNLLELLNSAAIQIPDGVGVLMASRMKGGSIRTRVTGIDLMHRICVEGAKRGYKLFLLGAKPGVAARAGDILKEKYNGLNIVGIENGYFEDENKLIEDIRKSGADVLFVAMGSPKQEYWIKANMERLGVPLLMGVGGSYDVICGNIKRAPQWMCKFGIEWLYRLIKEPWRYKRMAVLPKFLLRVSLSRSK